MACDKCGKGRGHMTGCPKGGKPARQKGDRHKRGDKGPGGAVPRPGTNYGQPCPPHNPTKVKYDKKKDEWYHRCGKCRQGLGWW